MSNLNADTIQAREGATGAGKRLPVFVVGAVLVIAAAVGVVLWARLGTAVFFEMISAGLAACF